MIGFGLFPSISPQNDSHSDGHRERRSQKHDHEAMRRGFFPGNAGWIQNGDARHFTRFFYFGYFVFLRKQFEGRFIDLVPPVQVEIPNPEQGKLPDGGIEFVFGKLRSVRWLDVLAAEFVQLVPQFSHQSFHLTDIDVVVRVDLLHGLELRFCGNQLALQIGCRGDHCFYLVRDVYRGILTGENAEFLCS